MFCRECGKDMGSLKICPWCSSDNRGKSRFTAGLLQMLAGSLGVGRFYLGYKGTALLQIGASLLTCGIADAVWGFVDGIMILNGSLKTDASGLKLTD